MQKKNRKKIPAMIKFLFVTAVLIIPLAIGETMGQKRPLEKKLPQYIGKVIPIDKIDPKDMKTSPPEPETDTPKSGRSADAKLVYGNGWVLSEEAGFLLNIGFSGEVDAREETGIMDT